MLPEPLQSVAQVEVEVTDECAWVVALYTGSQVWHGLLLVALQLETQAQVASAQWVQRPSPVSFFQHLSGLPQSASPQVRLLIIK